jgi:UDP-N-acetylglucosamine 2-epimerase (non-hydrolysing)
LKGAPRLAGKAIWVLVGTRPDVIKQAPVVASCRRVLGADSVAVVGTGQHRELLDQALMHFELELDYNLDVMQPNQELVDTSAAILGGMGQMLNGGAPQWLVVQGDTTSAAMSSWAAFQSGVPVAHNEAGLRTFHLAQPFPEEGNRRLISVVARLHFAPTESARRALLGEGVDERAIHVTGNTGIDALRLTLERPPSANVNAIVSEAERLGRRLALMTAHRRENRGAPIEEWFKTLGAFLLEHPDVQLIYPIHLNDAGRQEAARHLEPLESVLTIDPLSYGDTCHVLSRSAFVITDSGGIQEEAAALGVPAVVCRNFTERYEGVGLGTAVLAGTDPLELTRALEWANNQAATVRTGELRDVYGDGHSGDRIAAILAEQLA